MNTKKCSRCEKIKPLDKFYKNKTRLDGYDNWCKGCRKESRKERKKYFRNYYQEHKEERKKYSKRYLQEHKKKYRKYSRKNGRKRRQNNLQVNLSDRMSTAIRNSIKNNKNGRHWEDLVNYTLEELKQRLEVNFKEGMTWNNRGEWHIDHKKPNSLFNYTNPGEQAFKDCWSLANLQPLWAEENLKKGASLQ